MNDMESVEIEKLLRNLKPMKAPEGFSRKVMEKIQSAETVQSQSFLISLESGLLLISLMAILTGVILLVDLSFIGTWSIVLVSELPFLLSQLDIYLKLTANLIQSIPTLAFIMLGAFVLLWIADRLLRKYFRQSGILNSIWCF
ncbi:MAG: hypothetical protein Q8S18_02045 [Bacteroidales bacterium]|nr:hypothetical protein [Bacteroidales bacterium]